MPSDIITVDSQSINPMEYFNYFITKEYIYEIGTNILILWSKHSKTVEQEKEDRWM